MTGDDPMGSFDYAQDDRGKKNDSRELRSRFFAFVSAQNDYKRALPSPFIMCNGRGVVKSI
jgi:hypothetical protein